MGKKRLKDLQEKVSATNIERGRLKNKWKWTMLLVGLAVSIVLIYSWGFSAGQDSLAAEIEGQQRDLDQKDTENSALNGMIATLESEVSQLEQDGSRVEKEYEEYKTRMQPYEELEEVDAELKKVEAQKKIDEEKARKEAEEEKKKAEEEARKKEEEERKAQEAAEEEARKAEEAAQAEAKEKQGYETGITYDQLARTPDDYLGEKIKFSGKVLQVMEGDDYIHIRMAVNDDYDTVIFAEYDSSIVSSRILEDDYITVYGTSFGLYTYEATMGNSITIPSMIVDKIDR